MTTNPLSVSELTFAIKSLLEKNFLRVYVQGEISNCKEQSSGHFYFSLKDPQSQISAVLFKGNAQNLSRVPKSGDHVILKGELSVYPPRGNYQLIVRELSYQGVGELLIKLQALKEKLGAMGWFDKKKPLPKLPKRIGIITSPTGAVIQDILHVLRRRFSTVHVILYPVKVQGDGAKEEIAKAIYDCNQYQLADVLIVGRGGGTLEDLFAFNEEIVAKAIFESQIPIISAVGHETDYSIADFVADVRAPTPSAAAEIVIGEKEQLLGSLTKYKQQIDTFVKTRLLHRKEQLQAFKKQPWWKNPLALLENPWQSLDASKEKLDLYMNYVQEKYALALRAKKQQVHASNPSLLLQENRKKLLSLRERLDTAWNVSLRERKKRFDKNLLEKKCEELTLNRLQRLKENFTKLVAHLQGIDPKNLLQKGYSILFSENRDSIILSTKNVAKEQKIFILLSDGNLKATIKEIENKPL